MKNSLSWIVAAWGALNPGLYAVQFGFLDKSEKPVGRGQLQIHRERSNGDKLDRRKLKTPITE